MSEAKVDILLRKIDNFIGHTWLEDFETLFLSSFSFIFLFVFIFFVQNFIMYIVLC